MEHESIMGGIDTNCIQEKVLDFVVPVTFVNSVLELFAMEVFLTVRRHKTTIFTDAKESNTVLELKKIIQGILKVAPEDQVLYDGANEQVLDDAKTLADSGFTQQTAKAQAPAVLKLALREGDTMESLFVEDYSRPPELPDVMKPHDGTGTGDQKK